MPAPTSDTAGGADSAGVGVRYESLARFQDLLACPRRGSGQLRGRTDQCAHQESLRQGDGAAGSEQPARAVPQLRPRRRSSRIPGGASPASMASPRAAADIPRPSMPRGSPGPLPLPRASPISSRWRGWMTGALACPTPRFLSFRCCRSIPAARRRAARARAWDWRSGKPSGRSPRISAWPRGTTGSPWARMAS